MTEHTAAIILSYISTRQLTPETTLRLLKAAGSPRTLLEHRKELPDICPDATLTVIDAFAADIDEMEKQAQEELEWCAKHNVTPTIYGTLEYPTRLISCPDAPIVLYTHATANLNAPHTVSIVGTRNITSYGNDVINKLINDISNLCPDCTIISGLAYGVDIHAHRAAMAAGLPTVAVVAHGQDTLYPAVHRHDAEELTRLGGDVITEYPLHTAAAPRNFLQRNRIVAALGDATVVIESAYRGGALSTARTARAYGKQVFAVPGSIKSEYSAGCHALIRDGKAQLLTSATDIAKALRWDTPKKKKTTAAKSIERPFNPNLLPQEQRVVEALRRSDLHANAIALATNLDAGIVTATLFSLEMQGIVRSLPGNVYHLVD